MNRSQLVYFPIPAHTKVSQIIDVNRWSYLISLSLKVTSQILSASQDYSVYYPHLLIQVNLKQVSHIVYEHKFVQSISKFVVLAHNSVAVVLWKENRKSISLINLKEKAFKKKICQFQSYEEEREIFFFKQTQLTSICTEKYTVEDPCLGIRMVRLTYFQECNFDKPILECVYNSQLQPRQTFVNDMVHQGNNHSLMIFLKGKEGFDSYHFILQDLVMGEKKAQLRTRDIDLQKEIYQNGLCRLWSVGDFKAWMVPKDPIGEEEFTIINLFGQSVRKPNSPHIPRFKYKESIHFIEDFICVIHWNAQNLHYSLNFIDLTHQTLQVTLNRTVRQGALIWYEVSSSQENTILEIQTVKNKDTIKITKIKSFLRRQFYLQCLLWIDEDFDDDLLQQTLEVLSCIQ